MWLQTKKIKDLQEKTDELTRLMNSLHAFTRKLSTEIASVRGSLNRRLYSGKKLTEEETYPDWLDENLELLGAKQKDKKDGAVGM